jgi:molybdenum cofactor cytidylyltransferase
LAPHAKLEHEERITRKEEGRGMKIAGAVLAAGLSTRMGRPKALLPAGERMTFVSRLVTTLLAAGVDDVLVVVRSGDDMVRRELETRGLAPRARLVPNALADTGQLSSVQAAVRVARETESEGLLIVPVDVPLVTRASVHRLLDTFESSGAPVARASHGGRHGHPVIFARALFDELLHADPAIGARAVVRAHATVDVEVDDPGAVEDVDTLEDYVRLFGRMP